MVSLDEHYVYVVEDRLPWPVEVWAAPDLQSAEAWALDAVELRHANVTITKVTITEAAI